MTAVDLDAYLTTLQQHNTMSAELKLPGGVELRIVFGPNVSQGGTHLDETVEPGAWKKWAE